MRLHQVETDSQTHTNNFLLNHSPVLALVLLMVLIISCPPALAKQPQVDDSDQRAAERADQLYEEGDFSSAYSSYLRLAKKGDPFSQYRASFMNLKGQGVDPDIVQAFAWAVLAAESKDEQLLQYLEDVKVRVPESEREAAQKKAEVYLREWGKLALAREAHSKSKRIRQNCTGSRLGTRCDEVYAVQMPKFWSISPGVGGGVDGGSAAPSGSVSSAVQGGGGEIRDAEYYRELKQYTAALEQYIQEESGTVELGEFEVLESAAVSGQPDSTQATEDENQPR